MEVAGLRETWTSRDGDRMDMATMITTGAYATMVTVHHRMTVILTDDQWPLWLGDEDATEAELLADTL